MFSFLLQQHEREKSDKILAEARNKITELESELARISQEKQRVDASKMIESQQRELTQAEMNEQVEELKQLLEKSLLEKEKAKQKVHTI